MAAPARFPHLQIGQVLTVNPNNYVIDGGPIARTLTCCVFLAHEERSGQECVLKVSSLVKKADSGFEIETTLFNYLDRCGFKEEPRIVHVFETVKCPYGGGGEEIYVIAMERLGWSAYDLVRSRPRKIHPNSIALVAAQILQGLASLHQVSIAHLDIKPNNLMAKNGVLWKIIDLGIAAYNITGTNEAREVAALYYRPPEAVLRLRELYSTALDVYSLGCTLAEMFLGFPLFPAKSGEQAVALFEHHLTPSQEMIEKSPVRDSYYKKQDGIWICKRPAPESTPTLDELFFPLGMPAPLTSALVDLIKRMIAFNPKDRLTVKEALGHPIFDHVVISLGKGWGFNDLVPAQA